MESIEYKAMDRSCWQRGEWDHELIDRKQWLDLNTGYPCIIQRNPRGAWCGYVGVPETHPYFGKKYDDRVINIEVHGGLTFSDFCGNVICYIPNENKVWLLGFDCAHINDVVPVGVGFDPFLEMLNNICALFEERLKPEYRTQEYVTNETLKLAKQLKEKMSWKNT